MRSPDTIRDLLRTRYRNQHRNWLRRATDGNGSWPMVLGLGNPTEQDAARHPDALAAWVSAWGAWKGPGDLIWSERRWRGLGTHRLPEALRLHSPTEVAAWVGEESRWARACYRYEELVNRWPVLNSGLPRHFDVLADYTKEDFRRLETMLAWLEVHRGSSLYPRQLPVPGLDSKWLETRTSLIRDLFEVLCNEVPPGRDFYELCGLKRPPRLIRLMLLDESLRARMGGIRDLSVPAEELRQLNLPAARIYIVENLQTGLAFSDLPGSVVFMRLGYGIDVFGRLPWIMGAECVYWGDLDTHGLRILGRLRTCLPRVRSLLMDEDTLLSHRALWGEESEQVSDPEVAGLTGNEQRLYQRLKQQHWGINVRLEQERIAWDYAWGALSTDATASASLARL